MNFNGERLKSARIYRNMTITELAEKVNVSKQAISQYEKNQITPKPEVLFNFVSILQFPIGYFTEQDKSNVNIENTFFRALSSAKLLDLSTQEEKIAMIIKIYNFLGNYLDFPVFELPDINIGEEKNMDEIAIVLRSKWGLGEKPIENMVSLLERKGIIVSSIATDNKKIDAFTQVHNLGSKQQFCVVLSNDKQSMVRRNFDSAHELGHIILHNKLINVKELSTEEFKLIENEANQFAASFLMPRNAFFGDLVNPTNLDSYVLLKKKWKVSISAMVMRAKQIGRINHLQYQKLMKQISYRKWRICEPFDDIWELNRPILFKKAITILKENNVLSGQQLIAELSKNNLTINGEEVEILLDLDPGTLVEKNNSKDSSVVVSLKQYLD
ncbi:helix-turn-helix domain-containing protein [Clostridium tetani]|uniref:helix-turn-helix domain-containing protein n=1 Tax=Clostridium tetani TaxID=1513 RepID=UPI0003C0C662|nr:XRE family transcriptional regulator [Clostridium tetani]CDI50105.1 DNA-binding protein [Clostridium tetani 12124569]